MFHEICRLNDILVISNSDNALLIQKYWIFIIINTFERLTEILLYCLIIIVTFSYEKNQ